MPDQPPTTPTPPPPSTPAPRRTRRRWIVAVVLLVLAAPFVIWAIWTVSLRSEINDRIAAIKAAGEPVTLKELDAWYATPAGENAADLYIAAMDAMDRDEALENKLPDMGEGEVKWPAWDAAIDEAVLADMRTYVAANAEALSKLRDAAAVKECRYPLDLTKGLFVAMPDLGRPRAAAKLLRIEAAAHAEAGRPAGTTAALVAMMRLARSLDEEPTLISQLVRASIDVLGVHAIERTAARANLTDEQLAQLQSQVRDAMGHRSFRRGMAGERAGALGFMTGEVPLDPSDPNSTTYYRIPGFVDRDIVEYLRVFDMGIEVLDDPAADVDMAAAVEDAPWYCIMTRMILPATEAASRAELAREAALRCAATGLAIKRYQLAHGKLPATLDELAPKYIDKVYADPFDGKPLRYVVKDGVATVYSIGKDMVDDGGSIEPPAEPPFAEAKDVGFRVK